MVVVIILVVQQFAQLVLCNLLIGTHSVDLQFAQHNLQIVMHSVDLQFAQHNLQIGKTYYISEAEAAE